MTEFFMPMTPPTVTAQEHQVTVRNGKPIFYDTPEIKNAKAKLMECCYNSQCDDFTDFWLGYSSLLDARGFLDIDMFLNVLKFYT